MFTVQGRKVRKKKRRQCELADLWLFAECSAKELERLASLGTRIGVSAGRMLIERGTRGAEVLVVLTGSARCFVNGTEIARFGPGDFFGEVAVMVGGSRTATVVADTDMEVIVLSPWEFESLLHESPTVVRRIVEVMAERLRRADALAG